MVLDGIITGVVNFSLLGLLVLLRRGIHNEGIKSFLLQKDSRGRLLLLEGALVGCVSVGIYALILVVFDRGTITFSSDSTLATVGILACWGFGFLAVALFEEALFRGYFLLKLMKKFPLVIAIGLSSLLFSFLHLISYSSSPSWWVGLFNAGLIGVVLSAGVIYSRSLMWALGFHWTWNLTQTALMAEQNMKTKTAINLQVSDGLLGGTAGLPESGIIGTLVVVMLGGYTVFRFRRSSEATPGNKRKI